MRPSPRDQAAGLKLRAACGVRRAARRYDKVLKVKKAKFLRDQQANAATRKLREELERDEELAAKRKRHKFEA